MQELRDLNYYGLTVKGLKEGDYTVTIDGINVGKFSAKELAAGVNLGNLTSGPIWDQGKKVFDAINAKNGIVSGRFFDVVMFTGLLAQPEIDRPAASNSPPHANFSHDFGDRRRGFHHNILTHAQTARPIGRSVSGANQKGLPSGLPPRRMQ